METFENKYEKRLNEATHNFNIDPIDRSWFITPNGELYSEMSHRTILKILFPSDWNNLKTRNIDDSEIEEVISSRLIQLGWIKIGELDNFYSSVLKLDNRVKGVLYNFVVSLLKVRKDDGNMQFKINQLGFESVSLTLNDIANDKLFTLKESEKNFSELYDLMKLE